MKKPNRSGDGGGNWMDTYGDMVTLLLTFFILLYSMSSLNEQKWEVFVKSISPPDGDAQQISINQNVGDGQYEVTGSMNMDELLSGDIEADNLYLAFAQLLNENHVEDVTLSRGEGYTFIVFQDKTFFEGDSSVLTEQGKKTLDLFCDIIAPTKDDIAQIDIMGHTAQGDPNKPNNPRTDRMLSALRSAEVSIYIQSKDVIEPDKLVGVSYGQYRPVDTFETKEGRARNRRVELLLIDEGADVKSLNEYYDEFNSGKNANTTIITGEEAMDAGHGFTPTEASREGMATTVPPSADSVQETAETNPAADDAVEGTTAE